MKPNKKLMEKEIKFTKLGDSYGFIVPKQFAEIMDIHENDEMIMSVEIKADGTKRMIIEQLIKPVEQLQEPQLSVEEKLEILESLVGVLPDNGMNYKEMRNAALKDKYGL